jgi:vacuolar-type H+-ATPase subunit H
VNTRQRTALDRAIEQAQDRTRRNLNGAAQDEEQETRDAEAEAQQRRQSFHVVND